MTALFLGLQALPNLASLSVELIPAETTFEFAKLTQLVQLTYWNKYHRQLQRMVPFYVNFTGDREFKPVENETLIPPETLNCLFDGKENILPAIFRLHDLNLKNQFFTNTLFLKRTRDMKLH